MSALAARLDVAVKAVAAKAPLGFTPRVGVVLGSGLGAFADILERAHRIPYADVGFPAVSVAGHAGLLCLGWVRDVPVACLQGRVHVYEGYTPDDAVFAVRTLARWGCASFVLTNAAGGVNPTLEPADLMLISDHINLMGWNPLSGPNDETLGPRFVDLSNAYDPLLRVQALEAARDEGIALREGVYCALPGPAYETPAEIRMLQTLGADAVGMSTVPEVLALRHLGAKVIGLSCITNKGAGLSPRRLDHREVQEVADRTRARFVALLTRTITRQ